MTGEQIAFWTILAVNLIIVIVYLIWNLLRKTDGKGEFWIRAAVMLMCPVVGVCFFGMAHLFYLIFFYAPVDLEAVIFSKERVQTFVHADEESERNMVPLEEAIEVSDTDELRTLMMNIVRGDIKQSLAAISLALNSEDTETAHYAASVLQDALNDFRTTVQNEYDRVKSDDPNKVVYAGILIDYMNQVLEQKVLTDMEQVSYVNIMDEVCEILYEEAKERISSSQYEMIALRLLEIEDFEKCKKWCERAAYQYPNVLSSYTCQLKLYFNSGQREQFFTVIDELKKSAIVIDSETLELIRVFQK